MVRLEKYGKIKKCWKTKATNPGIEPTPLKTMKSLLSTRPLKIICY
jgi:hypothetical protein